MSRQRSATGWGLLLLAAWGVLSCAQPVLAAMAWASLEAARVAAVDAQRRACGPDGGEGEGPSGDDCVGTVVVCDVCVQNPRTAVPAAVPCGLFRTHEECELQGARAYGPETRAEADAPDLTSDWGQEAHWPCGPPAGPGVGSW